jgi:hypothetical protein
MVRIATIIILAILGHGLLMTSAAGAVRHADNGTFAMERPAVTPSVAPPAHDEICYVVPTVVKSSPMQVQFGARAVPAPDHAPDAIARACARVVSPHEPPDTIRALLQVYRI